MKFALVHNWPGQKNSELELIKRIAGIAGDLGHKCMVIDPFGHLLNSEGEHLDSVEFINWREYDFCLNLHYVNPNFYDTFSYAVNWNPLDYVVRNPIDGSDLPSDHVAYRTACLESHDALLSAGSEEMDDFAAALNLVVKTHIVNDKLYLHTTSEVTEDLDFPDLRDFRIFYIGANWEHQQGISRHGGLIERLDATNVIDFYGVNKQYGISLWKGVRNYKGELRFDGGKSILKKSNQCGVSLVLHSKPHRISGLVSTRIFQACAAKTLTICDNNPFILEHFGNSVLSFEYTDDPAENCSRIMEKAAWIQQNPGEALEMARKAHRIFVEKFSLRKEVANLFDSHQANVMQYLEEFGARDTTTPVDVLYIHRGENSILENFFNDLGAQVAVCPRAVVFVPHGKAGDVRKAASRPGIKYKIIEQDMDVENRLPLDGKIVSTYLQAHAQSHWFTLYSHTCQWKKMHLTQLVRAAEDNGNIAVSGTLIKNNSFSALTDDYYLLSMLGIGGHPCGITVADIGYFNACKFPASLLLFTTSSFQDKTLLRALRFFDKGWAFLLVVWNYLQIRRLPFFVPKLTTMFIRNDENWVVDSYINSRQTEDFERSLAKAFLKNDPYYSSISGLHNVSGLYGVPGFKRFSVNEYFQNILRYRPLLLKIYQACFRRLLFILGVFRKEVPEKNKDKNS